MTCKPAWSWVLSRFTLTREGEQMVLSEKRWTTRHPLMKVGEPARVATA